MRSLVMTVVLFGCGPNSALEVVVEMPPGDSQLVVDKVQLYIGLGHPQNASGKPERLVPRDFRYPEVPHGYYWKRDPNSSLDVLDVAPGATDVRFVFQEGSDDHLTAIVVGYRDGRIVAAASLVDAYLEAGSVRQYHVVLKPASSALPRPTTAAVTVHRWGPGPTDTQCAYLEDPTNPDKPSIFIVDHDDRDCDGFLETDDSLECLPEVYQGTRRPKREETRCLRSDVIPSSSTDACVLGGPGCVDGRGGDGACDAGATCVAPQVCVTCAGRTDALDCMATFPLANAMATRIDCTFFAPLDGGGALCPGAAVLSERFQFLPMCDVNTPYLFWATGQNQWKAQAIVKNGLTFTANKPTTTCDFALSATGTHEVGAVSAIHSVVNVQIANGRSGAVPISIQVLDTQGCDGVTKNECHVAGDLGPSPAFLDCLGSKVVEPW